MSTINLEENWRGVHSPQLRRKLQNRLNQRVSRNRRAVQQRPGHKNTHEAKYKWIFYLGTPKQELQQTAVYSRLALEDVPRRQEQDRLFCCKVGDQGQCDNLKSLEQEVLRNAAGRALRCELLLSVTQLNIIQAVLKNAAWFGLTMELLQQDIISPFNIPGPSLLTLPPILQATALQKKIIHHPWIDIIPIPSVRNMLLRAMSQYDEEELCGDFFGECGSSSGKTGLLIWGDALDPSAYEVSEEIVRRWGWMMEDCEDIIKSTNYWRDKRDEPPTHRSPIHEREKTMLDGVYFNWAIGS